MNAMLTAEYPLPRCLFQGADPRRHRRHVIGGFRIDPVAVDRFNHVLRQFADTAPVLDADRLATAAREMSCDAGGATAACLRQRLLRVKAAQAMAGDATWAAPAELVELVGSLLDQIRRPDHLLPVQLPRVGHLDDVLLVDAAWPRLQPETIAYADFRRLRRLAFDRGDRDRFDRDAWHQAREDEARLLRHMSDRRYGSYLADGAARFSVH